MRGGRATRVAVVIACIFVPALWAYSIRQSSQESMTMPDFSGIYFGARCVLHQRDPYSPDGFLGELKQDNSGYLKDLLTVLKRMKIPAALVYPPSALFVMVPLAALPWKAAENVFTILTAGSLALAGFLIWELGGEPRSRIVGYMIGFLLADCLTLFVLGNAAGIAVSFCIIAAWCFLEERFTLAGVVLIALSLMIKPHDSGFVWLYFLLAGGTLRKRALQVLALVALLGICAAIWIRPSSPHWFQEMHSILAREEVPGDLGDPGPTGLTFTKQLAPILSIQAAASLFKNDPHFYDPASYLIVGSLILIWAVTVLRKRCTRDGTLLALGAVSALTLLPVYHRTYDSKLLLLMIPAFGMLWAGKGAKRWVALGLTSAAIFFSSDMVNFFWGAVIRKMEPALGSPWQRFEALLLHPVPVVLLAAGSFYLWQYIRYAPEAAREENVILEPTVAAAGRGEI